jgi:uncharacterized protein (DUF2164 family)
MGLSCIAQWARTNTEVNNIPPKFIFEFLYQFLGLQFFNLDGIASEAQS